MGRLVTIQQAAAVIKEKDSATALTPYIIRTYIWSGAIQTKMSGGKYKFDLAEVEKMNRMRTIPQALKEFKTKNPDTALTEYELRKDVVSGVIPSQTLGKRLVSMDDVENFYGAGGEKSGSSRERKGLV